MNAFAFLARWLHRKPCNLNFDGDGRVSVPVSAILRSEGFKRQLRAIREWCHSGNSK